MQDIKVSIIVPIYNVEPYLRRCLDSLVNQTLKDIEIVCINDCSPDKSLVILKKYAKKDDRIKIIDFEKNQGVSIARNSGMKIAKGEYIGFCDSDDYVDLNFYEKLYKLARSKNADIAKANFKIREINSNKEFIENINKLILKHKGYFTHQFYTAIYRNKMLKENRVKFPAGKITGQDLCFSAHAVIAAKNIYVLNNIFYHYVRRDNSSASSVLSSQKMYSILKCCCLILNRLNKAAEKDRNYVAIYAIWIKWLSEILERNTEKLVVKKFARTIIAYYQKCKFNIKLDLPQFIIAAIKNKKEKELAFLLPNWLKWVKLISNDFYPFMDIKESALKSHKLYVWGTGEDGIRVKKQCESYGWEITAFLDSNKNIRKYNGYKVERPEQILSKPKKDFFIIISSRKYAKEITKICKGAGLKVGQDFWRPS